VAGCGAGAAERAPTDRHPDNTSRERCVRTVQPRVLQGGTSETWTDGRNVRIEIRWAGGDAQSLQKFAKEVVALQPDLILGWNTPSTAALLQQTRTIPIIFQAASDPVGSGFVASFSRPGGNVTGFTNIEVSQSGKWLELLKEIAPRVTRVAFSRGDHSLCSGQVRACIRHYCFGT
jgi:ABC-type uncharacterized transport system substrate-binding protein